MIYIATFLLFLMAAGMFACGILLWKHRHETKDNSRNIQAVLSWGSSFFALMFIFRTWQGSTPVDDAFFEPEHTFVPVLIQMTFFLYPLEVIQPIGSRTKIHFLLFGPLLLLVLIGFCGGIEYTTIHTYADLWQHIAEPTVRFRLLTLCIMLFYAFALFGLSYDFKKSCADRKFICNYAFGFWLIGVLHFSIQVSHIYWLVILHQVVWLLFFLFVTYYELRIRTSVSEVEMLPANPVSPAGGKDPLWNAIWRVMEEEEGWRNPDMSMSLLVSEVQSNRTYVNGSFQRNLGMGYNEYLMKRRIKAMVELLEKHPEIDTKQVYHAVGYRSRSTVSENFPKVMGVSLKDFLRELKM